MLSQALLCLALNIFFEARGESIVGMESVAQVTMTRAEQKSSNVCKVVFKRKQFSWTNRFKKKAKPAKILSKYVLDKDRWAVALSVAKRGLSGTLPNHVGDATHFYNPSKCTPYWLKDAKIVAVVDNHVFAVMKRSTT